jgi:hypothetical protein
MLKLFILSSLLLFQEPSIDNIRGIYKNINGKTLTKEQYKYEVEGCVEDGVVEYYLDKQQIVKIVESGAIGDGSWRTEYYYQNGHVIFCFESLIGGPANGPVQKTEHRVYVKDDKVIRFMDNQKIIPADSKSAELLKTGDKIFKAHDTKDFAGAICND